MALVRSRSLLGRCAPLAAGLMLAGPLGPAGCGALGLLKPGEAPPAFTLADSEGRDYALERDLGKKPIAIVFYPSEAFLQDARQHRADFARRGLAVLAIAPPGDALTSGRAIGEPVRVLIDTGGRVARSYHAAGAGPTSYVIGQDGRIRRSHRGELRRSEIFTALGAR